MVSIELTSSPLESDRDLSPGLPPGRAGACAEFRGLVRAEENGQPIRALEYEAYSPMAEQELQRLVGDLLREHACFRVRVLHRLGVIPAGESAIYVRAEARHRAAALAFVGAFLDRLKQDVPIWKVRTWPPEQPVA